jgi:hypothetical protein
MTSSIRSPAVDEFLDALDHPLKAGVEAIRLGILESNPQITEQIKWKAPSFCYAGDDRVTFNLRAPDRIQLIFHRGVRVKDASGFNFADPTGLMTWPAVDRAIVTFNDLESVERHLPDQIALVNRWMIETS